MTIDCNNITAVILAGGRGSRFDNKDKGLIMWQGQTLVSHVIKQIKPQVAHILISCNRNLKRYQQFGYPCIKDQLADFQGPLAGIQSALTQVKTQYCLTSPCDSPVLPDNFVAKMADRLITEDADLCYVFDGERSQYLLSLMRVSVAKQLEQFLLQDDRRVRTWHEQLKTTVCDLSTQKGQFVNINSPNQLKTLL